MNNTRYPGGKVLADVSVPIVNEFTGVSGTIQHAPHLPAINTAGLAPANNAMVASQIPRLKLVQGQMASFRNKTQQRFGIH